ncbi:polysaccharide lyase family 7 protein [Aquimarina pacifica]|uniref:polysaccharide lyase family 7 protein n=1 Tax=Aquimarina pacifica TaxID=1296415 RepID=UPI0004705F56|nr:polysaccharide lyase family 7 protein [Aquimarina pacifica]
MKKITFTLITRILFTLLFTYTFISCTNDLTDAIPEESVTAEADITQKVATGSFNWQNWYLSVPLDRGDGSGKATSIYYEDLEDANFTSSEDDYVWKNSDGSYTFKTKFTGYTTSGQSSTGGSKYCRTELREYWQGNQSTSDNWVMDSDTHILESTMEMVACGGNERTFVGQIHGYNDNNPATVKVAWDNGEIKVEYYVKPSSGEWTSDDIVKKDLGYVGYDKFTLKIKVENGKLYTSVECSDRGLDTGYEYHYDYKSNGYNDRYTNYFKTGNYFNWNDDKSETCEVRMYGISTYHGEGGITPPSGGGSTMITIKGNNNKYVSSENGTKDMNCNRTDDAEWEQFELIYNDDGTVSLKGNNGRYVTSMNGTAPIICDRTEILEWERFTLIEENGKYAFRGNNGRLISSENGTQSMTCNRSGDPGAWELFTIDGL